MKANEMVLIGISSVVVGMMLAFTPFVGILFGWLLAPPLVIGGILAISGGMILEMQGVLKGTLRSLVCMTFREEERGRPAMRHVVVNSKLWHVLGGGSCRVPVVHQERV